MRIAIAAALAALLVTPASAREFHHRYHAYVPTSTELLQMYPRERGAVVITRQPSEDAKWEAFCKPVLGPFEAFGVQRWTYAHEGCEFGRSE